MSDPEELPTLLDKATDHDSIYVRCPVSKVEDIAAEVILSKLDKLRRVEAILEDPACCEACVLSKIEEVLK